jgi:hypothetical protein
MTSLRNARRRAAVCAALAFAAALWSSCASYRVPTSHYGPKPDDPYYEVRKKAADSPIYDYVPRKSEQLRWLDARWLTWALAGNDDDGIFGECAGESPPYSTNISFRTYVSWTLVRNPLHNFDFYVIGSAAWKRHYDFSLLSFGGQAPVRALANAARRGSRDQPFFDIGFNDFKPYFKLQPWIGDLFFGWRWNGSFEIKVRADTAKLKKKPAAVNPSPDAPGANRVIPAQE